MKEVPAAPLKSLVSQVSTWNPLKPGHDVDSFEYIDLSAVDQQLKEITGARTIACADAPSRARQLVRANDVLVSTVRPNLNGVSMVPPELDGATASTGFCVIRANRDVLEPSYAFHWVKSPKFISNMVSLATGASYPAVSDKIVLESEIPLPPLPDQRRIAAILDKADALCAKRREALAKLDRLVASVFVETFGEPTLNARDWKIVLLGDVVEKITDGEHINPEFSDDGMPIIMAGNVLESLIDINNAKRVDTHSGQKFRRKCNPEKGDLVVVSRGATIGRMCHVNIDDTFCLMGSVILIKLKKDKLHPTFLTTLLKHPAMRSALYKTSGSSAQQAIYLKDLKNLSCIQPPLELQHQFAEVVSQIDELRLPYSQSLHRLDALFATLQNRAFRGEL